MARYVSILGFVAWSMACVAFGFLHGTHITFIQVVPGSMPHIEGGNFDMLEWEPHIVVPAQPPVEPLIIEPFVVGPEDHELPRPLRIPGFPDTPNKNEFVAPPGAKFIRL